MRPGGGHLLDDLLDARPVLLAPLGGAEIGLLTVGDEGLPVVPPEERHDHLGMERLQLGGEVRGPVVVVRSGEPGVALGVIEQTDVGVVPTTSPRP